MKYKLKDFEKAFLDSFKATHDLDIALGHIVPEEQELVNNSLNSGRGNIYKAFRAFINEAPTHPRANKVAIVNALVKALAIAVKDEDTNGIVRITSELNKMTKGNLVINSDKKVVTQTLVGIIDLSAPKEIQERTIDVSIKELN